MVKSIEHSTVPIIWLIIACFAGGTSLVAVAVWGGKTEAHSAYTDTRVAVVEKKQERYDDDIVALKNAMSRIEQKVDDLK